MVTDVENIDANEHLYVEVTETVCEIRTNSRFNPKSKLESLQRIPVSDEHSNGSGMKEDVLVAHNQKEYPVKPLSGHELNEPVAPKGDNQSDFLTMREKSGNDNLLKLSIDRNFETTISLSGKGLKTVKNDCQETVIGYEVPNQGDVPLFQIERRHIEQDLIIGDTKQESLIERKEIVKVRLSGSKLKIIPINNGDLQSQSRIDETVSITRNDYLIKVMDEQTKKSGDFQSQSKVQETASITCTDSLIKFMDKQPIKNGDSQSESEVGKAASITCTECYQSDISDPKHSLCKNPKNGELSGTKGIDQKKVQAKELVTITCSDAIIHVKDNKRRQTVQNGHNALDENEDIITGELRDKILLTENPNKEQNSTTKKSETSNKSFPGADQVANYHASETLASGVKSRNDQDSMVKSAIKKIYPNSDKISIPPKGDKPFSIASKDSLPGASGIAKPTGHTGKLLTTETFSIETVEIIKEVMSP